MDPNRTNRGSASSSIEKGLSPPSQGPTPYSVEEFCRDYHSRYGRFAFDLSTAENPSPEIAGSLSSFRSLAPSQSSAKLREDLKRSHNRQLSQRDDDHLYRLQSLRTSQSIQQNRLQHHTQTESRISLPRSEVNWQIPTDNSTRAPSSGNFEPPLGDFASQNLNGSLVEPQFSDPFSTCAPSASNFEPSFGDLASQNLNESIVEPQYSEPFSGEGNLLSFPEERTFEVESEKDQQHSFVGPDPKDETHIATDVPGTPPRESSDPAQPSGQLVPAPPPDFDYSPFLNPVTPKKEGKLGKFVRSVATKLKFSPRTPPSSKSEAEPRSARSAVTPIFYRAHNDISNLATGPHDQAAAGTYIDTENTSDYEVGLQESDGEGPDHLEEPPRDSESLAEVYRRDLEFVDFLHSPGPHYKESVDAGSLVDSSRFEPPHEAPVIDSPTLGEPRFKPRRAKASVHEPVEFGPSESSRIVPISTQAAPSTFPPASLPPQVPLPPVPTASPFDFHCQPNSAESSRSSRRPGPFSPQPQVARSSRTPVPVSRRFPSPSLAASSRPGVSALTTQHRSAHSGADSRLRAIPSEAPSGSPPQQTVIDQEVRKASATGRAVVPSRKFSDLRAVFEPSTPAESVPALSKKQSANLRSEIVPFSRGLAASEFRNSDTDQVFDTEPPSLVPAPTSNPVEPKIETLPSTPHSKKEKSGRFEDHSFTPPDEYPDCHVEPLFKKQSPSDPAYAADHTVESPLAYRDQSRAHASNSDMETLQVMSAERSSVKMKAQEDAKKMQQSVMDEAKRAGKDPPGYVLVELIGKGSFGRVYKGKEMISGAIVAVKIIDIDESDTLNPRLADTYSEFMKEVNALKILSESKARNINHVIEALPVGKSMWMVTEYCGGGSVATLMKPTPSGLKEKWIIPILREVAEAIKWVHQAGIIHRDIKCANVLITEEGGVQLCDFGVAGITESTMDKRTTFIGTPNWMAPELFATTPHYGKEVDIWAFGSMAYEMAKGFPPNAMSGVVGPELGSYLKQHIPRLETGGPYSPGLCSITEFCLQESVANRPDIEAVQKHNYIYNTNSLYPASSLSELVKAFKKWEDSGGIRKSLFMRGGAQGPFDVSSTALDDDYWNFSTTAAFDQAVAQSTDVQDVIDVYGNAVNMDAQFTEDTSRLPGLRALAPSSGPRDRPTRRRPPPEALAPLKAPLEKIFDPNTISNYEDNARSHYNRDYPMPTSDLPLRDDSAQTSIRDTMIDLGSHDIDSGLSSFSDMGTIKASKRLQEETEDDYGTLPDFSRPALSDPADNINRRTQDWKFPSLIPPASADPELSRFPINQELQRPAVTPGSGARPALTHHPTEPIGVPTQGSNNLAPSAPGSPNRMSLIDLDLSLPEPSRPSTADSTLSNEISSTNPFDLEKHASTILPATAREPSLYLPEDSAIATRMRSGNPFQDLAEASDFSASDAESTYGPSNGFRTRSQNVSVDETAFDDAQFTSSTGQPSLFENSRSRGSQSYDMSHFPPLPAPPSVPVLTGTAGQEETRIELDRVMGALNSQLNAFRDVYETLPAGRARRERERREVGDAGNDDL